MTIDKKTKRKSLNLNSEEDKQILREWFEEAKIDILNTRQTAQKLGVSLSAVYRYIDSGVLKAYKLGGEEKRRHWRIKKQDLEEFIVASRKEND